jgi:hypothetical protein
MAGLWIHSTLGNLGADSVALDLVTFHIPLVAVPEPSSLAMICLGVLTFAGAFYRRAKKA